jgi:hypothetical protein
MPGVNWPIGARRTARWVAVAAGIALGVGVWGGCGGTPSKRPAKEEVVWKKLGEWSGRGNAQTESFIGLTGSLRMRWHTKNEAPQGTGRFRLVLQSAISGRDLQEPVDETGEGDGTAYVADDPRVFQITVQSANLDWSFAVDEGVFGTAKSGE